MTSFPVLSQQLESNNYFIVISFQLLKQAAAIRIPRVEFTTQLLLKVLVYMPDAWVTKLMTARRMTMKRAPRTTITWRFENPMAPDSKNYMPSPRLMARLVMVVATLFRGRALMRCWFTANEGTGHGEELSRRFRTLLHSSDWGEDFYSRVMAVDVSPDGDWTGAIHVNHDAVCVDFSFVCANGEGFTHTACEKFIALVDALGDRNYRTRYYLPNPEISQVTMVEAYADDNWVEYGEYMWERFFASKADAEANKMYRYLQATHEGGAL